MGHVVSVSERSPASDAPPSDGPHGRPFGTRSSIATRVRSRVVRQNGREALHRRIVPPILPVISAILDLETSDYTLGH